MGQKAKCGSCRKFKRECECGRPRTITPEIEAKLEEAFSLGMPVVKALEYARVKKATFYDKMKEDVKFSDKIVAAQNEMSLLARKSLKLGVARNPSIALSYLERKEKDEFSTKQTIEHEGGISVKFSDEAKKRIGKYSTVAKPDSLS